MVLVCNMNYLSVSQRSVFTLPNVTGTVKEVLFGDVEAQDDGSALFQMKRTSIAGVIYSS